jgi:predicted ATPase
MAHLDNGVDARMPLVLVFEDLHWVDSESQALLNTLN